MSTHPANLISAGSRRLLRTALAIGCLVFALPLVALAYMGTFMRYSGDDWCYAAALARNGFFKAQWVSYTVPPPFNGNRFSLTFFSNLADLIGPYANAALPALAVLLWVIGTALALRAAGRSIGIESGHFPLLLAAETLIFFSLYLAPEPAQSLYWRSGMLPYLAPLVAGSYLATAVFAVARPSLAGPGWALPTNRGVLGLVGIGLLAWVTGGFSETGSALLLSALGLALLAALLVARAHAKDSPAHRLRSPLGAALVGAFLAALTLVASPTNAARLATLPPRMGLISLGGAILHDTLTFTYTFFRSEPLAVFLLLAMGAGLGVAAGLRIRLGRALSGVALTAAAAGLLVAACLAPSLYIQSSYPEARALVTGTWVMSLAVLGAGALLGAGAAGLSARPSLASRQWAAALAFLVLAISIFPFNAAGKIAWDAPLYQKWASFWDARHAALRQAAARNAPSVSVVQIDHIIPRVGELQADPLYWYNRCAEQYYGVDAIRADQPGWDQ